MRKMMGIAVLLILFHVSVLPQIKTPAAEVFNEIELVSPWVFKDGKTIGSDLGRRRKSCFDLVRFERGCGGTQPVGYGNRFGINWDIFATDGGGRDSQTRMIELGKYKWADKFSIPEVEPWSQLKPGEQRTITINGSGSDGRHGADGAPGMPGRNGDGSTLIDPIPRINVATARPTPREGFASASLTRQVTSTITMSGKSVRADGYNPFNEVKLGYMYLVRVVDKANDHYVLIRVEEVVRGEKVVFSYFRFPSMLIP